MDNMEFLKAMLAEMNAKSDANQAKVGDKQEEILAKLQAKTDENQERMAINLKERKEMNINMKATQERMEADRKSDREDLKGMMEEMMNANQEEKLARMREGIKSGQAEMKPILDAWLMDVKDGRKETTACQEATETEPNPGMLQSIEGHQEIPKGEAAGMPVVGPRKRRRVRNLAAERRQKRKERTRGYSGSRRKLAAACRKVSRRAKVAWRKRNIIRKIRTLEKCGRRKEFAAAGIRTTR
jgi:hypothetical protein